MDTQATVAVPGLAAALVRAQRAAKAVEKDSTNTFHRYKYASGDDIIAEGKRALSEHGLAILPVNYRLTLPLVDAGYPFDLATTYHLVHESGEVQQIESITPVIPEKGRPPDKAVAAAKTNDLAYAIRGVLCLPRGDMGEEIDQRDDRGYDPRRPQDSRTERDPAAPPPPPTPKPPQNGTASLKERMDGRGGEPTAETAPRDPILVEAEEIKAALAARLTKRIAEDVIVGARITFRGKNTPALRQEMLDRLRELAAHHLAAEPPAPADQAPQPVEPPPEWDPDAPHDPETGEVRA